MTTARTSHRTDGTERPTMDWTYMMVAFAMSHRSSCPEGARHGAVLVLEGRIIATGYGSPAAGVAPCTECWLRTCKKPDGSKDWEVCPSVHAEINAILMSAKFGIPVHGSTLYVTKAPCEPCLRMLHNAGVAEYKVLDEDKEFISFKVYDPVRLGSPKEWQS